MNNWDDRKKKIRTKSPKICHDNHLELVSCLWSHYDHNIFGFDNPGLAGSHSAVATAAYFFGTLRRNNVASKTALIETGQLFDIYDDFATKGDDD